MQLHFENVLSILHLIQVACYLKVRLRGTSASTPKQFPCMERLLRSVIPLCGTSRNQ